MNGMAELETRRDKMVAEVPSPSYWAARAAINQQVALKCAEAGFTYTANLYASKTVFLLSCMFAALAERKKEAK